MIASTMCFSWTPIGIIYARKIYERVFRHSASSQLIFFYIIKVFTPSQAYQHNLYEVVGYHPMPFEIWS